jgi:hypothetical protein
MSSRLILILAVVLACSPVASAGAQNRWSLDLENGAAISGYNNARIPGDSGTLFSFTTDLASGACTSSSRRAGSGVSTIGGRVARCCALPDGRAG